MTSKFKKQNKYRHFRQIDKISRLSDNDAMKTIHRIIEQWISDNPSGWFLQHNRFK